VCRRKMAAAAGTLPVAFLVCSNENLDGLTELGPFDGALSNFGGLNCTADLDEVGRHLASLVRPGGSVFLCIMGRVCAWEIARYVLTGQWKKALRRLRPSGSTATIGGLTIRVHYPSVRQIARTWAPWFRIRDCRGIGIFVPPSWMEPFFRNWPRTLRLFEWLDRLLGGSALAGLADHVLLRFAREIQ
ncbi:MAG: class I SAM-dependent methyltransferase, partial [Terracidiphilus sp.]